MLQANVALDFGKMGEIGRERRKGEGRMNGRREEKKGERPGRHLEIGGENSSRE